MSRFSAAGASLAALWALLPVAAARCDTPSRTRVTIRGTGSDVVIERSEAPVSRRIPEKVAIADGPLDEAVRLKAQGANDAAVIAYLRAHQAELPPVVESEDVKQLRKAGAGKGVVAYLTTVAAVDIGETGEGFEADATVVSARPDPQSDMEAVPYGVPYGYALSGGYFAPNRDRHGRRGSPRLHQRTSSPRGHDFQRRVPPSNAGLPRYPARGQGRF